MSVELVNPLIITSIGIMILAIAIAFMLSSLAKKPEWEAWAKVEINELMWSVILLLVIFGIFKTADALANAWVGTDMINYTESRLSGVVKERLLPAYINLLYLDHNIAFWNQWKMRFGPEAWGFKYKEYPGLEIYSQPVRILEFGYMAAFSSLSIQAMALHVIRVVALNFLLPAGILLRFFPPTRGSGNLLIGMAFAFQIIFPLFYVLSFQALDEINKIHGWDKKWWEGIVNVSTFLGTTHPMLMTFVPGIFTALLNTLAHLSIEILVIPSTAMTLSISATTSLQKMLEWKTIELGGWK